MQLLYFQCSKVQKFYSNQILKKSNITIDKTIVLSIKLITNRNYY
ncbi:hypothetical protein ECH_0969 [Ehrlichia chaffeensis str. Arkansas]|uniref:Uncharacterized protein n=1 Tax=Ehrlichia chaffeensis (strain ATCC CRL-10679 / Arkansas) TaxID=205920 RepID=Q2GFM7_EHRCR|nr:hypothetical protein ECH_0969 [Ehrlichia chaffeensis str. Arkansas]